MEDTHLAKFGFGESARQRGGSGSARRGSEEGGRGKGKKGDKGGGKGSPDKSVGKQQSSERLDPCFEQDEVKAACKPESSNAAAAAASIKNNTFLSEEERMHLEATLNYVAFSHKERQQRVFLPTKDRPPPPPKRPLPNTSSGEADAAGSAKAN